MKGRPVTALGRAVRWAALALAAFAGLMVAYVVAAVPGALLRPEAQPHSADRVYPVYLVWSEIHTDLILPVRGASVDWHAVLDDPEAAAAPPADGYVAFGWGSESFYRDVPTLAELSPYVVARAMFFDATVLHVFPVFDPTRIEPGSRRTLLLTAPELAALEQHVLSTLALDAAGVAEALPGQGYGYGDAFYRALGRYNPIRTCNQWTSEGLRLAGVPVGWWTPFSQSITWMLGTDAAD